MNNKYCLDTWLVKIKCQNICQKYPIYSFQLVSIFSNELSKEINYLFQFILENLCKNIAYL